ncbi:MAG: hypothetical protein Kow00124_32580 [Anaerolineae bacterium]
MSDDRGSKEPPDLSQWQEVGSRHEPQLGPPAPGNQPGLPGWLGLLWAGAGGLLLAAVVVGVLGAVIFRGEALAGAGLCCGGVLGLLGLGLGAYALILTLGGLS